MSVRENVCKWLSARPCSTVCMFLYKAFGCEKFEPQPPEFITVIVCTETGLLVNDSCDGVEQSFEKGTEPTEMCQVNHAKPPPPEKVTRTICEDSALLRRKHCVTKVRVKFNKGSEPTEQCNLVEHMHKRTVTPYRLFENTKVMAGVNPGDLHSNVWRFHDGFTKENYVQVDESLAQHCVNAKRYFGHTGEEAGDLDPDTGYLVSFKRLGKKKFYLWELDPEAFWGNDGIFWRYIRDVERAIIPIICLASGWKPNRYMHTAWHPNNNIGVKITTKDGVRKTIYMTADAKRLITDPDSARIFRGVAEMYVEVLKELEKYHPTGAEFPGILESVNEYDVNCCGDVKFFEWHHALFSMLEKKHKLDPTRMAFEKWNSRWIGVAKIPPKPGESPVAPGLQDLFPGIRCFYHGQNTYEQAERWHRGEMGDIHHYYEGLTADSDGVGGLNGKVIGEGLIGKGWGGRDKSNIDFRRICPVDLEKFLKYDYNHEGGGYNHLSAVQWYEDFVPRYDSFVKAFVRGFTKAELFEYKRMVEEYRGIMFDIKWENFSYPIKNAEGKIISRKPLSEGMAIRRAMHSIHKDGN